MTDKDKIIMDGISLGLTIVGVALFSAGLTLVFGIVPAIFIAVGLVCLKEEIVLRIGLLLIKSKEKEGAK